MGLVIVHAPIINVEMKIQLYVAIEGRIVLTTNVLIQDYAQMMKVVPTQVAQMKVSVRILFHQDVTTLKDQTLADAQP